MAETLTRVAWQGLVHALSPYVRNVTTCGWSLEGPYERTIDAPTCFSCIVAEETWERILRRTRARQQVRR